MANIGHFAFERFNIGLPQRQGPVFFAASAACSADAFGKVGIIAEQARKLVSQSDGAGPGEGGNINHRSRNPGFLGIGQRIAQGEAAFRIGILDFNGIAIGGAHHIAGAHGAATGHVFGAGQQAHHAAGRVFLRKGRHRGQHRCGAGHVGLHLVHVGGGLEADAACIKGDALAHKHEGLVLLMPGGGVLQHDEAGRTARTLAHGHEAAHAFLFQIGFVQHGAGKALFARQFLRLLGQHFGVEQIGRRGGEVTGQAHGPGGILASAGGGVGGVRHFLAVKGHGQPLRVGGFVRIGLFKGRKAVQGKLRGANAFFHQPFTATGQPRKGWFGQHYGCVALLAAQLHCGGYGLADVAGGELFPRAKAYGQDPRNGKVGMPVQQGQFARLALEVAQGRGYDQPGSNLVQFRNLFKQGFVLANGCKQNITFPLFRSKILKAYIHRAAFS